MHFSMEDTNLVRIGLPIDMLVTCSNIKCQDKQDGALNFGFTGCIIKPSLSNGQRYLVPTVTFRVNCAHCNRQITSDQLPSGTTLTGFPFAAVTK